MEFLVIYYVQYMPIINWFDNRLEAINYYKDCKSLYSNVTIYCCKEVLL